MSNAIIEYSIDRSRSVKELDLSNRFAQQTPKAVYPTGPSGVVNMRSIYCHNGEFDGTVDVVHGPNSLKSPPKPIRKIVQYCRSSAIALRGVAASCQAGILDCSVEIVQRAGEIRSSAK